MPCNQPDWYGFLGRISKPTASFESAVLLELMGRTRGVLEWWRKGEEIP